MQAMMYPEIASRLSYRTNVDPKPHSLKQISRCSISMELSSYELLCDYL